MSRICRYLYEKISNLFFNNEQEEENQARIAIGQRQDGRAFPSPYVPCGDASILQVRNQLEG